MTSRLPSRGASVPSFVKVVFDNPDDRRLVLLSKSRLRYSQNFQKVFIRPNLPAAERRRRKILQEIISNRQENCEDETENLAVVLNVFKEKYEIRQVEVTEHQTTPGVMTTFYCIDWQNCVDITSEEEQAAIKRMKHS